MFLYCVCVCLCVRGKEQDDWFLPFTSHRPPCEQSKNSIQYRWVFQLGLLMLWAAQTDSPLLLYLSVMSEISQIDQEKKKYSYLQASMPQVVQENVFVIWVKWPFHRLRRCFVVAFCRLVGSTHDTTVSPRLQRCFWVAQMGLPEQHDILVWASVWL